MVDSRDKTEYSFELIALVEMMQGAIIVTNACTYYCQVYGGSPFASRMVALMGFVGFLEFLRAVIVS